MHMNFPINDYYCIALSIILLHIQITDHSNFLTGNKHLHMPLHGHLKQI